MIMKAFKKKAIKIGGFFDFSIGGGAKTSILQYVDDMVCVGKANTQNLWTLKAMLRCFELEFRLKVNFNKSNMFGINVQTSFMVATSNFLCCNISDIPLFFKFLGLPIDANPIRMNNLAAYHRLYQKKFGFIEGQILVHRG